MTDVLEAPWDTPWPPEPSPGPTWSPLTLAEMQRLEVPDLSYVIDGLVPAGSLTLLAGREKSGKSLAVLDAAASVAGSEEWAGRTTINGPVIYCPAEDSIRTVRDRLMRRIGGDLADDGRPLLIHPLSGISVQPGQEGTRLDLNDAVLVGRLWEMVSRHRPVLLALDCLRELHGARENESDDMTVTMRPLRQLAHELNVAVVIVHHASKGVSGSSRGSTAIPAACDADATWTASGDGSEGDADSAAGPLRATLSVRGRDVPKTVITLELGDDLRFRPMTATGGGGAGLVARDRILTTLADGRWRTATEITAAAGVPGQTIANTLSAMRLEADAPVERSGAGVRGDVLRYRLVAAPGDPGEPEGPVPPRVLPLPGSALAGSRNDPDPWLA